MLKRRSRFTTTFILFHFAVTNSWSALLFGTKRNWDRPHAECATPERFPRREASWSLSSTWCSAIPRSAAKYFATKHWFLPLMSRSMRQKLYGIHHKVFLPSYRHNADRRHSKQDKIRYTHQKHSRRGSWHHSWPW
jgi:hypothetical protein